MNELKRCPFCGGGAETIEVADEDGDRFSAVECQSCYSRTDGFLSDKLAIEHWNRRINDHE